mmetsp:Transcript_124749/g.353137  ORF Transcript_124749/g.353137 Transcript_124749/m.353137 type:complete len:99 (+) Transcript_124749:209-505(+)
MQRTTMMATTAPVGPSDPPVSGAGGAGGAGGRVTVEEALQMVLDKKTVQYRGGLIGIVHAAGVQEMTPFSAHSPAKFDFLFAPKSQAGWNMHQFSQVI